MGPSEFAAISVAGRGAGVPVRELLLVAITSAVITFLATGLVRIVATRAGALAVPRDRDVHVTPIPRLGGVGLYLGLLAGLGLAQQLPALTRGFEYSTDVSAVLWAGGVIVVVGVIDDRWGLDAFTKFVGQVTAAGVLVLLGISWYLVYNPFGGGSQIVLDQLQAGLVTVALTVVMINAMNFIDGLDGLLAGVAAIAACALCAFSTGLLLDQGGDVSLYPPALITAALAGACVGFLPHNFQPARIFMGDSGSMLIGLTLAAASTSASGEISSSASGAQDVLVLLSPILLVIAVVFVPFLDLVLAIIRRTRAGASIFRPDKMHLHHRLLTLGHSHRRAVLLIYLWVATLAFGVVSTTLFEARYVIPAWAACLLVVLVATAVPRLRRQRLRERAVGGVADREH